MQLDSWNSFFLNFYSPKDKGIKPKINVFIPHIKEVD